MSLGLRNREINYQEGWFFVTFQVANNKSLLGAIVGKQCCLNELGQAIESNIKKLPTIYKNVYIDKYVVMPNHIHMIVKLFKEKTESGDGAPDPRYNDCVNGETQLKSSIVGQRLCPLSRIIGAFKSYTSNLYLKLKKENKCPDIGSKLWQSSFYDVLISDYQKLLNIRNYIENNPKNWEQDRFGPVTSYSLGNIELLNECLTAFVASEGLGTGEMHCIKKSDQIEVIQKRNPIISTFSSFQERKVFQNCLKNKRPFIKVCPSGIPRELDKDIEQAIFENRGLLISPISTELRINKQRANVCNHYVLKNAVEIWIGHIRPGGSLETILKGIYI